TDPRPTEAAVQDGLGGVLCRCTGYRKIVSAVMDAWRFGPDGPHGAAHEGDVGKAPAQPAAPLGLDFRMPASGRAVGGSPVRLDGCKKVTGAEKFGSDGFPADALAVAVIRAPYHRA